MSSTNYDTSVNYNSFSLDDKINSSTEFGVKQLYVGLAMMATLYTGHTNINYLNNNDLRISTSTNIRNGVNFMRENKFDDGFIEKNGYTFINELAKDMRYMTELEYEIWEKSLEQVVLSGKSISVQKVSVDEIEMF